MKKIDTLPREHTKAVITLLKNEVRSVSETFISSTVSMWSASKDGSVCVWTEVRQYYPFIHLYLLTLSNARTARKKCSIKSQRHCP